MLQRDDPGGDGPPQTPAPPEGEEPARPVFRAWIAVVLITATIVTAAGTMIRLPVFSIGPGAARDVARLVSLTGADTYPSAGSFILTTVAVSDRNLTLFEGLRAWLDPAISVIDRSAIIEPGLDDETQTLINRADMERSKQVATVAALRTLGMKVDRIAGARILTIVPGSPADGRLKPGDRVVEVDGVAVTGPQATIEELRRRKIGDDVSLLIERNERPLRVTMPTVESITTAGEASVGATVADAYRMPVAVDIDTANIGGPSGGLVFALTVMDLLGRDDLTGGHRVAATGTIGVDGTVGLVGGVEEKVVAAERAGATIFLVPFDEVEQAIRASSSLTVIGVRTLAEALEALRDLPQRETQAS